LHAADGALNTAQPNADTCAMDIFDLLAAAPFDLPGMGSRDRDPRENAVAGISLVGFPLVDFSVVLFAGVYSRPTLALLVLPLLFAAACAVLSRALRISLGAALKTTVGCALLCLLASIFASFLGAIASFYSGF
jgi:hypothetical protein